MNCEVFNMYDYYNVLLETSDLDNFRKSLEKPNGQLFNNLINILKEEEIEFSIVQGYDSNSKDKDIKEFNKISIEFENKKDWKKTCENYSLDEVFEIIDNKDCFIFKVK